MRESIAERETTMPTTLPWNEIRLNPDHTIDEVCLSGVDLHLEQMGRDSYWIGVSRGADILHIDIKGMRSGRLRVRVRDEGFGAAVLLEGQLATSPDVE
jgi:hypothetical protein